MLVSTPPLDEVLAPRLARMAVMRRVVVRRCLKVVLEEEAEHGRKAADTTAPAS